MKVLTSGVSIECCMMKRILRQINHFLSRINIQTQEARGERGEGCKGDVKNTLIEGSLLTSDLVAS